MKFAEEIPDLKVDTTNGYDIGRLDEEHTLLGYIQTGNGVRSYYVECSVCKKDKELWGSGVFIVNLRELRKGRFCGCNCKSTRGFPECHLKTLVERKCEEKGYHLNGYVGRYKGKSNTYLDLTCTCGHAWNTTSITKLVDSDRGCPNCAGNIPWDLARFLKEAYRVHGDLYDYENIKKVKNSKEKLGVVCRRHGEFPTDAHHHISRAQGCPHPECAYAKISEVKASSIEEFVAKAKLVHGDTYDYTDTEYHRSFTKLTIYCKSCEEYFPQSPTDHLSGCGCPYCAGKNQKQSYIFTIGEYKSAFKFGIANIYLTRFNKQSSKSPLDVEVFGVWEYDSTEQCKNAERYVINNYNCGYLTKSEYPDGYSETLNTNYMDKVVKVYEDFGGRRIV